MAFTEFGFSVDDFLNPKQYKDPEAIATLLTRLLLLEPGLFQSHPDMGVGLISRFRYSVEGSDKELRSEFERQINKYLPQFEGVRISVRQHKDTFYIGAEIDEVIYSFYYDSERETLKTTYVPISSLG